MNTLPNNLPKFDYREQLRSELERRKLTNSRYSLRSFAKAIDLSPAFLSKLLKGEKNLSSERALSLAEKLGYTESEINQFVKMVQMSNLGSERLKNVLEDSTSGGDGGFANVELEIFQIVSDWQHFAILELSCCYGVTLTPAKVSEKLGLSEESAKTSLARLEKAGLLVRKNGRLVKSQKFLATPSGHPHRAIKNFHSQMIHKAGQALQTQSVESRDISGITLAINRNKLEAAKKEIKNFRRRMAKLLDASRPDSVYQLNVQFFSLLEQEENREKIQEKS